MPEPLTWDDIDGKLVPIDSLAQRPEPPRPPRISKYEDAVNALTSALLADIADPKPEILYPPVVRTPHSMSTLSRDDILHAMRDVPPCDPRFTHVYGDPFGKPDGEQRVYLINMSAFANRILDVDFETPLQWGHGEDLIRYRDAYNFSPRLPLAPMLVGTDSGGGYTAPDPAGWRRYGTKARPVRANKRRRLARRFPLSNCRDRHKHARAWQGHLKRNPIPQ